MADVSYEPGFSGPATISHGDPVTITSSGNLFGSKPTAAPLLWDDASGPADVLDLWSTAWPNQSWNIARDEHLARRGAVALGRNVDPPHSRTGRYICGAHNLDGHGSSATGGNNVMFWLAFSRIYPVNIYQSCWMRADPNWYFWQPGDTNNSDNNFKCYIYAHTNTPSTSPIAANSLTLNYSAGAHPESVSSTNIKYHAYGELAASVYGPVSNCVNPMKGWTKFELLWEINNPGRFRVYEDGRHVYGRSLAIDQGVEPLQSVAYGDYARQNNFPSNWRYYTDAYLDTSFARVMLTNAGDTLYGPFGGSTTDVPAIRENQIPTAWLADGSSITFTCNGGAHPTDLAGTTLWIVKSDETTIKVATLNTSASAPPVIVSPLTEDGTVGVADSHQVVATNNPTSFSASPLPPGMTFDTENGLFSGTYTQAGTFFPVVQAINSFGSDQKTLTFDVTAQETTTPAVDPPVLIGSDANKTGTTLTITVGSGVPAGATILIELGYRDTETGGAAPTASDPQGLYAPDLPFPGYVESSVVSGVNLAMFRRRTENGMTQGQQITITVSPIDTAKVAVAYYVNGITVN